MFSRQPLIAVFFLFILSITANLHISIPSVSNSPLMLPTMPGTTVTVTQGNNQGDHIAANGSEYAFDFIVGQKNFVITAAQSGTVIGVNDSSNIQCGGLNWEIAPKATSLKHCWAYANFVLIADDDRKTAALYMHLLPYSDQVQMPKVSIGEHVNQGEPIGLAGTTGWSSGVHLHFQVESLPSSVPQQSDPSSGWWWTNSLPTNFSNPEVLAQDVNGVPQTGQCFVVSNPPQQTSLPPTRVPPTPVIPPTPVPPTQQPNFSPFVGAWDAHSRYIIINKDGTAKYAGRTFATCGQYPPPCDNPPQGGMDNTIKFTSVSGLTIIGTIASGTGVRDFTTSNAVIPVGSKITFTLQADVQGHYTLLEGSDGWLGCYKINGSTTVPPNDPHYADDCNSGA